MMQRRRARRGQTVKADEPTCGALPALIVTLTCRPAACRDQTKIAYRARWPGLIRDPAANDCTETHSRACFARCGLGLGFGLLLGVGLGLGFGVLLGVGLGVGLGLLLGVGLGLGFGLLLGVGLGLGLGLLLGVGLVLGLGALLGDGLLAGDADPPGDAELVADSRLTSARDWPVTAAAVRVPQAALAVGPPAVPDVEPGPAAELA